MIKKILCIAIVTSILVCGFCSVCHARGFVFAYESIYVKVAFQYYLISTNNETDPKGTNTVFNYNSIGKVVQERSVDNTIRTCDYDRAGRLVYKSIYNVFERNKWKNIFLH